MSEKKERIAPRCENCGKQLHDLTEKHEDTGYVCTGLPGISCQFLYFPSDFQMSAPGYVMVPMYQ